ncbi:MAG: 3-deoxy-manno-octulosonate cytidylyltransferase [Deltaproteobacteria bacterium]|nr:MAG: 3-deoxy-manno-octulosonate cytidylyltransferase [Deltaproteobacteria bacterium]
MSRVYAFIPARYRSTRFPGKPLASIAGKPMIRHVYERAALCPEFSGVFVATDDERISDCVKEFGGRVVMTGREHPSGTDRICEAALKTGLAEEDIVINIQGDQPLFDPSVVSRLVAPLEADASLHMSTLKYRLTDPKDILNPNHVKVVTDLQGTAIYFSRCPIPYFRDVLPEGGHFKHLGFYGYRMGFLTRFTRLPPGPLESAEKLEQLRALEHGFRIRVVETIVNSIEVDVPEDIHAVEAALRRSPSRGPVGP